jgi:hypothetical protein
MLQRKKIRNAIALVLLAGLLLGCSDDDATADTRPADLGHTEGLLFPDTGVPTSDADAALDAPLTDGADLAYWPDAPVAPDLPLPDLPVPDLPPPDLPPPQCSLFSQFNCNSSTSFVTCSATCKVGTTTLGITCLVFGGSCLCIKNGNNVGNCPLSGSGCSACQNAFPCCASKF